VHGLDLSASWWVGDRLSDVQPASAFGGTGLLVETGEGRSHREAARAEGFAVVPGLEAAVTQVLAAMGRKPR
jgi:histidinol phosphatase-like enzyme